MRVALPRNIVRPGNVVLIGPGVSSAAGTLGVGDGVDGAVDGESLGRLEALGRVAAVPLPPNSDEATPERQITTPRLTTSRTARTRLNPG